MQDEAVLTESEMTNMPQSASEVMLPEDVFSVPTGELFRFLLLRNCFITLSVVILAGMAVFIIGFAIDLRLVVVSLMIWFICLPMIIAWCWFRYALTEVNAWNLVPHQVKFHPEGIEVTRYITIPAVTGEDSEGGNEMSQITVKTGFILKDELGLPQGFGPYSVYRVRKSGSTPDSYLFVKSVKTEC